MHIDDAELEELRDQLEVEKNTLEDELASHGRVVDEAGEWAADSSGLSGEEADPSDAADQIEELVTNVPLVGELEKQHKDVLNALKKMDDGTYGTCEECGAAIPLERLEANPAARACVKHG